MDRMLSIRELERGRYETDWIDLKEGTVRREEGLGRLCRDPREAARTFYWSISPDGRWGVTVRDGGEALIHRAVRLDDGPVVDRFWTNHQDVHIDIRWVSDSSGFVEWPSRPEGPMVRFHWLESGGVEELRLTDLPLRTSRGVERLNGPFVVVSSRTDLPEAEGQLLVREPAGGWARCVLDVPSRLRGREFKVAPSPSGDRLAWIGYFRRWLPEISSAPTFPFVSSQSSYSTVLFVSRMDGRQLRTVGSLPVGEEINRVAWLPGGKSLSFVVRGGVWTVPVSE